MDELFSLSEDLFDYFELEGGEWPMMSIYSGGDFYRGVIDDELYNLLTQLYTIIEELKDSHE